MDNLSPQIFCGEEPAEPQAPQRPPPTPPPMVDPTLPRTPQVIPIYCTSVSAIGWPPPCDHPSAVPISAIASRSRCRLAEVATCSRMSAVAASQKEPCSGTNWRASCIASRAPPSQRAGVSAAGTGSLAFAFRSEPTFVRCHRKYSTGRTCDSRSTVEIQLHTVGGRTQLCWTSHLLTGPRLAGGDLVALIASRHIRMNLAFIAVGRLHRRSPEVNADRRAFGMTRRDR